MVKAKTLVLFRFVIFYLKLEFLINTSEKIEL